MPDESPGSPEWHYREADRLLRACDGGDLTNRIHGAWIAKAQVHAILALLASPDEIDSAHYDAAVGPGYRRFLPMSTPPVKDGLL